MNPTRLGFLSLEFIVGDDTYWLTTGLGRDGYYFTQLPRSVFGDTELLAMGLDKERDYSEITVVEQDGKRANLFCSYQGENARYLDADVMAATRLSWNELAARLIDLIPLKDQCSLWHHHILKKTDPTFLINEVLYQVTAFLPEQGIFAIRGEDWNPPMSSNWLTIECPDEAEFKRRLRQFSIQYLNINNQFYPV